MYYAVEMGISGFSCPLTLAHVVPTQIIVVVIEDKSGVYSIKEVYTPHYILEASVSLKRKSSSISNLQWTLVVAWYYCLLLLGQQNKNYVVLSDMNILNLLSPVVLTATTALSKNIVSVCFTSFSNFLNKQKSFTFTRGKDKRDGRVFKFKSA